MVSVVFAAAKCTTVTNPQFLFINYANKAFTNKRFLDTRVCIKRNKEQEGRGSVIHYRMRYVTAVFNVHTNRFNYVNQNDHREVTWNFEIITRPDLMN